MANIKLDLAGFKHVKSDDNSTTLKHEKLGHTVTLAHNVLSPANKAVLKAIAKSCEEVPESKDKENYDEGGKVAMPAQSPGKSAPAPISKNELDNAGGVSGAMKNVAREFGLSKAEGGEVAKPKVVMAAQSDPEPPPAEPKPQEKRLKNQMDEAPQSMSGWMDRIKEGVTSKENLAHHAEGGEVDSEGDDHHEELASFMKALAKRKKREPQTEQPPTLADTAGMGPVEEQPDIDSEVNENEQNQKELAGFADQAQPQPVPQAAPAPQPMPQQPQAAAPQAPAPQPDQPNVIPRTQVAPADYSQLPAQQANQFLQEDIAYAHDLNNGHITPKTYSDLFAEKSTLGKIAGVFGLLLGGAGSGLTHQPNAALQMMDNIIQRDVDAQKNSKSNAQNLYKLNLDRRMNDASIQKLQAENRLTDAHKELIDAQVSNETVAKANRNAFHDLTEKAKALPPGSPQQKNAYNALAIIGSQVDAKNAYLADQNEAMQGFLNNSANNSGNSTEEDFKHSIQNMKQMGGQWEKRANDMESKHIPGEKQMANRPIESKDRDALLKHHQLDASLKDLQGSLHELSSLNPASKDYIRLQSKILSLQSQIRESDLGTVFKESEQPLLDKILRMPVGKLNEYQTRTQVDELRNKNGRNEQILKSSYGIKSNPGKQEQPKAKEGQILVDKKSGKRLQVKDGKLVPI